MVDEAALESVAAKVGTWDILILNAPIAQPLAQSPHPQYQTGGKNSRYVLSPKSDFYFANSALQTNVKGTIVPVRVFFPTANPTHAIMIGVTSASSGLHPAMAPFLFGYNRAKWAQIKVLEHLAAENPNIFVASFQPGFVGRILSVRAVPHLSSCRWMQVNLPLTMVSMMVVLTWLLVQLPAHFLVLSSPEAAFLKGRLVWANWDVDELESQAEEIAAGA